MGWPRCCNRKASLPPHEVGTSVLGLVLRSVEIQPPFHPAFSGYEALKGPKEISGFEGDTVSLQCTYEKRMRGYRKYWCRQGGLLVSRCGDIVYTNQNQEVTRGMMSIRDSPRELSMTVTMRRLTLKDSGKYWCGIDRLGLDESFEVTLIVFPGNARLSSTYLGDKGRRGDER